MICLDMSKIVLRIKPDNNAPGISRAELESIRSQLGTKYDDVALIVSELVSNSVRHAASTTGTVELVVTATDHKVRLEVSDDGPCFEVGDLSGSGFGLGLVDKIANNWGIERSGQCTVWAELTLEPSPAIGPV